MLPWRVQYNIVVRQKCIPTVRSAASGRGAARAYSGSGESGASADTVAVPAAPAARAFLK